MGVLRITRNPTFASVIAAAIAGVIGFAIAAWPRPAPAPPVIQIVYVPPPERASAPPVQAAAVPAKSDPLEASHDREVADAASPANSGSSRVYRPVRYSMPESATREVSVSVTFLELSPSSNELSGRVLVGRSSEPLVVMPNAGVNVGEPSVTMASGQKARVVTRTMTLADLRRYEIVVNGQTVTADAVHQSSDPLRIRADARAGDVVRAVFYDSRGVPAAYTLN